MKAVLAKYEPFLKVIASIFIVFLFFDTHEKSSGEFKEGINLEAVNESYDIRNEVLVLKDSSGQLQINDVSQAPANWGFMPAEKKSRGIWKSEEVYWVEINTDNGAVAGLRLLVLPRQSIGNAVLYSPNEQGGFSEYAYKSETAAGKAEFLPNDIVFPLETNDREKNTFFLKIETGEFLQFPMTIWNQAAYANEVKKALVLTGIFIVLSLLLTVVCFFYFYTKRQYIYLKFLIFSSSLLLLLSLMSEFTVVNVFPDLAGVSSQLVIFALGFSNIYVLLYIHSFLEKTAKDKGAQRFFKRSAFAAATLMLLQFISYTAASYTLLLLSGVNILYILFALVKSRKYDNRYIRVQFVSFTLMLLGLLMYGVAKVNWISYYGVYKNLILITVITAVLLAGSALHLKEKLKAAEMAGREKKLILRLQKELEALKKMDENKNELLEVTAHSLRTPLYGMIGVAESLLDESRLRLNPSQSKQMEIIIDYGKKLAHKLNDLSDFSKIKQNTLDLHVESISLHDLVNEVLEVCRPLLKNPDIRLYSTLTKDLPNIAADPYRIQQILYNLVDNAIKHTEEGEIVISAKKTGKQLAVTVRDTGTGIESDRMQNLYEPLKRGVKSDIGIGLSISKRLIELHGGWLKAESHKNTGTTFTFTLPIEEEHELDANPEGYMIIEEISAADLKDPLSPSLKNNKKVKVLVVEKETMDRNILMQQLQKEQYEVLGTGAGSEAFRLMDYQQIDLIILDWSLEDMSGNELCRMIRKKFTMTELPILMLSTKIGLKEKMEAFSAGANDYLVKPCDKEEFLLRVETLANLKALTQEITNMNYVLERNVKEKTMALEITNMNLVTVNDEIQEIEKSRNEMLSSISHELGTPITLIHSYIQAVQESLIDEKNPRYLDMIHKKLLLLERLTEDLVELGKYKSGNMTLRFESVNFRDWFKKMITGMEADIRQSGRLFEYTGSDAEEAEIGSYNISVDGDRIDQVFSNILWNAVKNTSSVDGKITVSSQLNEISEETETSGDGDGAIAEIVFKISDTGYGIPEEILPHIFDRFFKLDNNSGKKGSGLGLAIAKEIVQSHRGRIWAESEIGIGSSFFIALPLYK